MMQTTVPAEHQALGRKAKGFDRKKWDECLFLLVERLEAAVLIRLA